jgi:hypothetical protein
VRVKEGNSMSSCTVTLFVGKGWKYARNCLYKDNADRHLREWPAKFLKKWYFTYSLINKYWFRVFDRPTIICRHIQKISQSPYFQGACGLVVRWGKAIWNQKELIVRSDTNEKWSGEVECQVKNVFSKQALIGR